MNNLPIRLIYVLSTVFLVACGASSPEQNKAGTDSVKVDTSTNAGTNSKEENGIAGDSSDFNNATYCLVLK
jgi:predicted component of type VI protein secretion system